MSNLPSSSSKLQAPSSKLRAQSGIFNLRVVLAFIFGSGGIWLGMLSLAAPTPTPGGTATPTPCSADTPSYSIHMSPPGFGDRWGEPSIGVNWNTEKIFNGIPNGGTVMSWGGWGDGSFPNTTGLRITFDDTNPLAPVAKCEQTAVIPITGAQPFGDPILFTDHETGRTFFAQLIGLTPLGSTTEFTNDDGITFLPSEGSGIPSGIDHETIGGGPFAPPLTGGTPAYQNAVYYCSQFGVNEGGNGLATCSLSADGGVTFGPGVPIYAFNECGGLHGHLKVSPKDGTVYIPNRACGSTQGVVVSEDNGTTWTVHSVTGSTPGPQHDPSVAVATDGTVYFGYENGDGHAHIARSTDKGLTWENDTDVGAQLGIQNSIFPAVVAGDPDRAAFAFFGTTTPGNNFWQPDFTGVWYLFVATTYDSGVTWVTQNVTPGDPIQRGGICDSTNPGCRNLLDFIDATIDKEGRVLVGYDDGCITSTCIAGGPNDFTSNAAIARQLGGKRMFSQFDSQAVSTCPVPTKVVSRKTHGSVGTFDIDLPLTGTPGIECRSGGANGDYTMVFTFSNSLTSVAGATATTGSGSVVTSNIDTGDARNYIVNLTGVTNAQLITVSLNQVTDSTGNFSSAVSGQMGVLVGDVNANGIVSNTDVASVKSQVAAPVDSSNFRNDVNANGVISNTDVSLAKAQVGTTLP
jgi:Dockerin type I domain